VEQDDNAFLDELLARPANKRRHRIVLKQADRQRLRAIATTAGITQWPISSTQDKLHAFIDQVRTRIVAATLRRLRGSYPTLDRLDAKYRGTPRGELDRDEQQLVRNIAGYGIPWRWYSPEGYEEISRKLHAAAAERTTR
jgi:hypothetical protein